MAHKPQLSTDRFAFKLGLFYAAYFLFGGIQLPFFPLWLEAKGLDAGTIGIVIAVPMIARIVAVPIITRLADRRRAIKATLVIIAAVGALAMTRGRAGAGRGRDPGGVHGRGGGVCADAVVVRRLCAQRAGRAGPRLRSGAAVGLGRLHRGECRRRRPARRDRPGSSDLADCRGARHHDARRDQSRLRSMRL